MRPTTQIPSMMTAAGSMGPETAFVERIKAALQRPKVIAIVTAKAMASFARLLRLRGGVGGGFCSGCGVGGVLIEYPLQYDFAEVCPEANVAQNVPPRLKPLACGQVYGTAEAVPLTKRRRVVSLGGLR
jgi:hypothetical protein